MRPKLTWMALVLLGNFFMAIDVLLWKQVEMGGLGWIETFCWSGLL